MPSGTAITLMSCCKQKLSDDTRKDEVFMTSTVLTIVNSDLFLYEEISLTAIS